MASGTARRMSLVKSRLRLLTVTSTVVALVGLQALAEIGRDGDHGHHVQVLQQRLGPGCIHFLQAEHIRIPDGLGDLGALRAAVLDDQRHRAAPDGLRLPAACTNRKTSGGAKVAAMVTGWRSHTCKSLIKITQVAWKNSMKQD